MHHNILLVAAGLFYSPIFAAPNVNNRLNLRKGHRQRQAPAPISSVGAPWQPPSYGPPPDDVTVATVDTSTTSPDSTSIVIVDPVPLPLPTTSACSVIRITEYVTVYGTSSSTSSPGNFTSAPYGWNSSVTSSWLLTGTAVTTTTTSEPYFPISNSTTSTGYGTDGTSAPTFVNTTSSPTFVNSTSSPIFVNSTSSPIFVNSTSSPTFANVTTITTTVNSTELPTILPTSTLVVPSNFTSFPNISTPDVTPTPIPTSSVIIPGNFTSFANVTSTPEVSILPIPASSYANVSSIPVSSYGNVSSVPASTTTEEPTSSEGPTVTSITVLPTETTVIVPGESSTATVITSLIIDTSITPIETATTTSATTSPTLVIVTTLTPIATASSTPSEFPTVVVTATNTVSSDNAPTGTPSPEVIHCGIRGSAIGTYYLATYAYNRAGVPVTLEGCYQFCSIAVEQCYSYEFYLEPGLGAPRCKLYGGLVAYEVVSIDPFQPYQWFDVACGDPLQYNSTK